MESTWWPVGCEGEVSPQECLLFWFQSSFNPLGKTGEKCKTYMPKEQGLRNKKCLIGLILQMKTISGQEREINIGRHN